MQDGQFSNTIFEDKLGKAGVAGLASMQNQVDPATALKTQYVDLQSSIQKSLNTTLSKPINPITPDIVSTYAIDDSGRFGKQLLGWDNEDIYASSQTWAGKAVNGLLKGLNLAGTTFLQGTVGMIYGLASSVSNWDGSKFYDNNFSNAIDDWNKKTENWLPNYYTSAEREANWYEPKNLLTVNFLFDKFIKNLGFSVGAIYSGAAVSKALKLVPAIKSLFDGEKAVETLAQIESKLGAVPALQRSDEMYNILRKASDAVSSAKKIGGITERAVIGTLGAATEAGIEALQGVNDYRNNLLSEYKSTYGADAPQEVRDKIDKYAERLGNARFGLNVALLTATNYVMLPKILGTSYKTSKTLANKEINSVVKNAEGKWVDGFTTMTTPGKFLYKAKNISELFFSPTEGFEEISQYAIERGVNDYYNKAYRGDGRDFIGSLGKGYSEAVNSNEGMEQFLIGALSGGIQQAGFVSTKGFGKSGNIGERGFTGRGGQRRTDTDNFLAELPKDENSLRFKSDSWLKDMAEATARGINLQEEGDAYIRQGDVLESKDNEADYAHNYLSVRIKHGRYDMVKDDISSLRQEASTEDGLTRLKQQGIANENDTQATFLGRLNNFERHADNVNSFYKSFNLSYSGLVYSSGKNKGERIYTDSVIDKMVYAASKIADYEQRIPDVVKNLTEKGVVVGEVLKTINETNTIPEKATKEALQQINDLSTISEIKDNLKTDLRDAIEMSKRRNFYLKEFEAIKEAPKAFENKMFHPDQRDEEAIVKQRDEEGKSRKVAVEIGKEYSVESEPLFRDGNKISVNPKLTILSKTLGGEYEVAMPDGTKRYLKPTDLKDYQLRDPQEPNQELDKIVENTIYNILKQEGYGDAVSPDSDLNSLVEFVNILNSNVLTNKIQKAVRENTKDIVEKLEKLKKEEEDLKKNEELKKKLEEHQGKGDSNNQPPGGKNLDNKELSEEDNKQPKPDLANFLSKEADFYDPANPKPHQKRRFSFLTFLSKILGTQKGNKVKVAVITASNEESFGLKGFINLIIDDIKDVAAKNPSIASKYFDEKGNLRPEHSPVIKLYVVQEGGKYYPSDVNGKVLSNNFRTKVFDAKLVFEHGIFSTFHSSITGVSTFGTNAGTKNWSGNYSQEDVVAINKKLQDWRELMLKTTAPQIYNIQSVSRGVILRDAESKSVEDASLATDSSLDSAGILVVPTIPGDISINGISLNLPVGVPTLVNGSTIELLNSRKFTEDEAIKLFEVIKAYVAAISAKDYTLADRLDYYIRSVVYKRTPKDGEEPTSQQIFYSKKDAVLVFGNEIKIPVTVSHIEANKDALIKYFQDYYLRVNNATLKANEEFEVPSVENGVIKWKSYKSYSRYLLSSKDGNKPFLLTKARRSTGSDDPNIIHRYSTLSNKEFEYSALQKQPDKKEEPPKPEGGGKKGIISGLKELSEKQKTENKEEGAPKKMGLGLTGKKMTPEESAKLDKEAEEKAKKDKEAQRSELKSKFKNKKPSVDKDEFSVVNNLKDYKKANLQKELEYIKSRSPFSIELLENLISVSDGVFAWGSYKQMLISLYRNMQEGTGYHELFEGVWSAFTSPKQKAAIISEFRSRKGSFTAFDGTTYSQVEYSQASEFQAKEKLADEFASFVLTKDSPKETSIKSWFKNLLDMILSIFNGKVSLIDNLFKDIDAGVYKSASPIFIENNPQYSLADLSFIQRSEIIKGTALELIQKMISPRSSEEEYSKYGPPISLVEFEESEVSIKKLYDLVYERFREIFEEDIYTESLGIVENEDLLSTYENLWENIKESWDDVKDLTNEYLKTFNIVESEEEIPEVRTEKENYSNRDYVDDRKYFQNDAKNTASRAIKILFATLAESEFTSTGVRDAKSTSTLMKRQVSYAKNFNKVMSQLSSYNTYEDKMQALETISEGDPNIKRLYLRLTTPSGISSDADIMNDWKLKVRFYQTMSKQEPSAWIQYNQSDGTSVTRTANLEDSKKVLVQGWIDSLKQLATQGGNPTFSIDNKGNLVINTTKLSFENSNPKDRAEFLAQLGITFTEDMQKSLPKDVAKELHRASAGIAYQLKKSRTLTLNQAKDLELAGNLNSVAEAYIKAGNDFSTTFSNLEGERQTTFISTNAVSRWVNDINNAQSLDELIEVMPQLKQVEDSVYLNTQKFNEKGESIDSFKLRIGYIQGTLNGSGKPIPGSKLSVGQRLNQEINQNINGRYYILVPADSNTQWLLEMKNMLSFKKISENSDDYKERVKSLFVNYYNSEKAEYEKLKNKIDDAVNNRFGAFMDISNNYSMSEEEFYIKIGTFFNEQIVSQKRILKSLGILNQNKNIGYFEWANLDNDFAKANDMLDEKGRLKQLSEKTINDILTFRTINYAINNIEMHKLFFGSTLEYKDSKRYKLFLSPREISMYGDNNFNNFLNSTLNSVDGVELQSPLAGKWNFSDNIATVKMADVISSDPEMAKISKDYLKIKSTDAQAWSTLTAHRERRLKNGNWFNKDEEQYQYIMAQDRQAMLGDGVLNNSSYPKELQEIDKQLLKSGNPDSTYFYVEKPILSTHAIVDDGWSPVIDKFSIVSVSYSGIRHTNFRDHYIKMMRQKIGYIIVESGRKVGDTEVNKFYNEDGSVNTSPYTGITSVPFKDFGVQTDTSSKKEKQTRGTQITKLALVNLYNSGKSISDKANALAQENISLLKELVNIGYKDLLYKIGAEDTGSSYRIVNKSKIVELVKDELLRRDVTDNVKNLLTIKSDGQLKTAFEAMPNYIQIKNILYSYVDKHITHPKVSGSPKVQVSGALMESHGIKREKLNGKDVFVSSGLKFYTKEKPWMEIMLPFWAARKLKSAGIKWSSTGELYSILKNSPDADKILSIIGFRIPTQELNSIENIKIAGFLPEEFGDMVVVPEAITTKAGSDFDIDKLNTYIKNIFVDSKGVVRSIPYYGIGDQAKKSLKEFFTEQEIEKLFSPLTTKEKIESYLDRYDLEAPLEDEKNTPEERLNEVYRQSVENRYYENLSNILELPENFERLVTPNTADTLKGIRNQLIELAPGEFNSNLDASIISPIYMLKSRHEGVSTKDLVGIAAVSQTGTAVSQLTDIVIDPRNIKSLSSRERNYISPNNGQPLLPHNKSNGMATISAIKDREGYYITDNNSQFINGTVDVFNDAFLPQINYNRKTAPIYHLLVRLGVPNSEKHPIISFFMNQPIIREYLNMLDSKGKSYILDQKIIPLILSKFSGGQTASAFPQDFTELTNILKDNISKFYSKGLEHKDNGFQRLVFIEFLKYSALANNLFRFQQGSNYDTARMNDSYSLFFKEEQKSNAETNNIFSDVNLYLNSTFIGTQRNALISINNLFADVFPILTQDVIDELYPILARFSNKMMSPDDKNKIARKIELSLLNYLIQTKTGINNSLKHMLVDSKTALVNKLRELKNIAKDKKNDQNTIWGNIILRDLIPFIDGNKSITTKNITLAIKPRDVFTKDLYYSAFNELYNNPITQDFARALIKLSFLQSGTSYSRISIKDYIPAELYAITVNSIISSLSDPASVREFVKSGAFYRNNWNDGDIVPSITSNEFPLPEFMNKEYREYINILKAQKRVGEDATMPLFMWIDGFNMYSPYLSYTVFPEEGEPEDAPVKKYLLQRVEIDENNAIIRKFATTEEESEGDLQGKNRALFIATPAWGDSFKAQEHYPSPTTSVFFNGYIKPSININVEELYEHIMSGSPNSGETGEVKKEVAPAPKILEITEVTRENKKEKYKITLASGDVEEREGYRLHVKEYPGFVGYIHKTHGDWSIDEMVSGMILPASGEAENSIKSILATLPEHLNSIFKSGKYNELLQKINLFTEFKESLDTKGCTI